MKRFALVVLAGLMALAPSVAQSKKVVKQAKEDSKLMASQLKSDGYKTIVNVKLDDAVKDFLTAKYSDKTAVEVVGKATSGDLNEAKAQARQDAVSVYPAGDVINSFFVYKKSKKKYDVVCYALLGGSSAAAAASNPVQAARVAEGSASTIATAKALQDAKDAKAEAKKTQQKAKSEAKKADKKAKKEAAKIQKKADKDYQKAIDKAEKKRAKTLDKLN